MALTNPTRMNLDVLQTIVDSHYLSTRQLAALLGKSEKATRDHLDALRKAGMLESEHVARGVLTAGALGMAPDVQVPTARAYSHLDDAGERRRPGRLLAHGLAVRDVLVWFVQSARTYHASEHGVEYWNCTGNRAVGDAIPDALLSYRFEPGEQGRSVRCLIEADMGTERAISRSPSDRWGRKIDAYSKIYAESPRDALYRATGWTRARILVTVETDARAAWIADRVRGSVMGEFVWIATRTDLAGSDVYAPVWLRSDRTRHGFL